MYILTVFGVVWDPGVAGGCSEYSPCWRAWGESIGFFGQGKNNYLLFLYLRFKHGWKLCLFFAETELLFSFQVALYVCLMGFLCGFFDMFLGGEIYTIKKRIRSCLPAAAAFLVQSILQVFSLTFLFLLMYFHTNILNSAIAYHSADNTPKPKK